MKIIFLGTGTSYGIPVIGCNCSTCTSSNPKDKRYRSSILVKYFKYNILIDTPPEMRLQMLENNISKLDLILFTHSHADHLMGFDDIRAFNNLQNQSIPCYGNEKTINRIKSSFSYIFNNQQMGGGIPRVSLKQISSKFYHHQIQITPLPVKHGNRNIFGYKINNMAYITDCSHIPESTLSKIKDIDLLIIDALRYRPHSTHMNIKEAVEIIKKIKVNKAYLTHISHDIEHKETSKELPENIFLAYDGLKLNI